MNSIGKAGSIVTIIGSAFMAIFGIILCIGGISINSISKFNTNTLWILGLILLGFGIVNIILCSIAFKGNPTIRIVSGIISLVSLFVAWIAWFFPLLLVIIGGVLLLCYVVILKIHNKQLLALTNILKVI